MPVLEASALDTDPEGVELLRGVLGAGMSPTANPVRSPDISERFPVPPGVCRINDRSVGASVEIAAENDALAEVESSGTNRMLLQENADATRALSVPSVRGGASRGTQPGCRPRPA
jgi:hypothetical protein